MRNSTVMLFCLLCIVIPHLYAMDDTSCHLQTLQVLDDAHEPFVFNKELTSLSTLLSLYGHNPQHAFKDIMVYVLFNHKFICGGTIEEQRGSHSIVLDSFPLVLVAYRKIKEAVRYALLFNTNTIPESDRLKGILLHNQDAGPQQRNKISPEKRSYPSSPVGKSPQKSPLIPASLASSHENMRPRNKENVSPLNLSPLERSTANSSSTESDTVESEKSSPITPRHLNRQARKLELRRKLSYHNVCDSDAFGPVQPLPRSSDNSQSCDPRPIPPLLEAQEQRQQACATTPDISHTASSSVTSELDQYDNDSIFNLPLPGSSSHKKLLIKGSGTPSYDKRWVGPTPELLKIMRTYGERPV